MSDMAVELVPRPITVQEYHRMAEIGIIAADERVELLDGVIVTMPPFGIAHWATESNLLKYLMEKFGDRARIVPGMSLPLGDRSEPQPDIAIVAKLPYRRLNRTPEPSEVYALIELADSSLAKDMRTKRSLYARFAIADYLVVDLNADTLLHFRTPAEDVYAESRVLGRSDTFSLTALPDISLDAGKFLDED